MCERAVWTLSDCHEKYQSRPDCAQRETPRLWPITVVTSRLCRVSKGELFLEFPVKPCRFTYLPFITIPIIITTIKDNFSGEIRMQYMWLANL